MTERPEESSSSESSVGQSSSVGHSSGAEHPEAAEHSSAAAHSTAADHSSHAAESVARSASSDEAAAASDGESAGAHAGDEDDSEGGDTQAADGQSADGQPAKRKRRRRRKKKSGEGAPEGETQSADAGGEPARAEPPRERREPPPFQRFIEARGGDVRRSAFAVGEIVAGMTLRVEEGVAAVDLFGRAIAFTLATEPREIAAPAPDAAHEAEDDNAGDPGAVAAAAAHLEGSVGMPGSESLPPPPPVETAAPAPRAAHLDDDDVPGGAADPLSVGGAAHALRGMSTPMEEDGPSSELPPAPAESTASGSVTAPEEAPATEEENAAPPLEVGSVFRGRVSAVSESGHVALYNRVVVRSEARARLAKARDEHRRVYGIVFGFNRGGFDVLVEGVRAFCPISGLALDAIDDPDSLLGQRLEFSVQQAKSGNQGIVVSRRSILEREARRRARDLRRSLQPGQRLRGRVTHVRDFGVFVDLGGVEGLVHMSEVSWDRGVRPADAARPGDEVEVVVLRVGEGPPRRDGKPPERRGRDRDGRISLSNKATLPDPIETNHGEIAEGPGRQGQVTRPAEFGAFIELAPAVEGLLHVSELGQGLKHAGERVKEGEEIYVVIERIDIKGRRVSLSRLSPQDIKAFEEGELEVAAGAKAVRPGALLKVKVDRVEQAGLHVQIEGVVGRRGRGFIPNSEMGTERGTDHRRRFPPGTEIDVKVIGVDRDGGLRCSRKGFLHEEERRAVQDYRREAARKGFGTFGDILKSKLGG